MNFDPYISPDNSQQSLNSKTIQSLINQVFDSPAGLKLLGYLESITILRPVQPYHEKPAYGYFREGQNDIIRQLLEALTAEQPDWRSKIRKVLKN